MLGAHVHAPGGFIHQHHRGGAAQPPREHHLLLVTAGEVLHLLVQVPGDHLQCAQRVGHRLDRGSGAAGPARADHREGVVGDALVQRQALGLPVHAQDARLLADSLGDLHDLLLGHRQRPVRALSVAEQQIVEIAKAVSQQARILCMDEPTAALADNEVDLLYTIIATLKERGVAIVYVSHRLREVFDLCDTITVLKDGRHVTTQPAAELDDSELVRLMVGRSMSTFFPDPLPGTEVGGDRLVLSGCGNGYVDGIDLHLRAGEIVGVAGLQGSGRTELLEGIFGVEPFTRGTMHLNGRRVRITSPRGAIRRGIAMVTEDRKVKGLALNQSIADNTLAVVRASRPGRTAAAAKAMPHTLSALEVVARHLDQEVQYLSGGNQQKVVLARWLSSTPTVMLMDEPTRGVDVGAKHAIYELMRRLAADGVAILMVSSELPEVIGIADRVVVMNDGRISGHLPGGATEEQILALATWVQHIMTEHAGDGDDDVEQHRARGA